MPPATLRIKKFPLGPFETNCYVVWPDGQPACWIIDAGFGPRPLIEFVRQQQLTPAALVLTHAHVDHIAGVPEVRSAFPGLPVWIHQAEARWLEDPELNLSAGYGFPVSMRPPDALLAHDQHLSLAGVPCRVLHAPGHSPGSVALHFAEQEVAYVGDTLFAGSVGRTDFPGCDFQTLARSIRERLYPLPDATVVLPGHGPQTTIGEEKRSNPFVRPA